MEAYPKIVRDSSTKLKQKNKFEEWAVKIISRHSSKPILKDDVSNTHRILCHNLKITSTITLVCR